jgi:hypothetical protein
MDTIKKNHWFFLNLLYNIAQRLKRSNHVERKAHVPRGTHVSTIVPRGTSRLAMFHVEHVL